MKKIDLNKLSEMVLNRTCYLSELIDMINEEYDNPDQEMLSDFDAMINNKQIYFSLMPDQEEGDFEYITLPFKILEKWEYEDYPYVDAEIIITKVEYDRA